MVKISIAWLMGSSGSPSLRASSTKCLEYTVFRHHAGTADPVKAEILRGIVSDERRHMGFGENDLGRRLLMAPHTHDRLN